MLRPRPNFREAELWFYLLPSRKWVRGRIFRSFKDLKSMLIGRKKLRTQSPIVIVYKIKS